MTKILELRSGELSVIDIPMLETIHLLAFPHSAMTRLGKESIQLYYHWLLTGPFNALHLGVWANDELVGFCFCGRYSGVLRSFLTHNRTFLIRRVLVRPWLVFNPLFRQRIHLALGLLARSRNKVTTTSVDVKTMFNPSFGILAIATHPAWQGQGIGRKLMVEAEQGARQNGYRSMHLTVHPDNQQAIRFYEGLGWHKEQESGSWRGQMVKELR